MDAKGPAFDFPFSDWLARLEELAEESGIALPLELKQFEPQYRAGQTPIQALEDYATGHGSF